MTTQKQSSKDDESTQSSSTGVEIEQTRRLRVLGLSFEETSVNGIGKIKLSGEGVKDTELSEEDVGNVVRFFTGFQRRQDRGGQGASDGRGQVTDPSSDARLKGNEDQRPHDPSRARQSGTASSSSSNKAK